jgi:hypothetical protein
VKSFKSPATLQDMKSIFLLVLTSSFIFDLGLNVNSVYAATQPNPQEVINVPVNPVPLQSPKVNSPNRTLTTEELFQQQQTQWQNQQELWQQKQTIWQRRRDIQLQQQNSQQLREIQRQQEFKIRGKYPSIFLN